MGIEAAYLIPHAPVFIKEIGGEQIEQVTNTLNALEQIRREIEIIAPDTILIISPHGPIFSDAIAIYDFPNYEGDLHAFGAFDLAYTFDKDQIFIRQLMDMSREMKGYYYPLSKSEFESFQYEPRLDHGITVPLHFVYPHGKQTKIVAMSYGTLSYLELLKQGRLIKQAVDNWGGKLVIIASGDMSHALKSSGPYTLHPNGIWFDTFMKEHLANNKPFDIFLEDTDSIESAKECGLRSFAIMMGALSDYTLKPEVLSYEGPFGVGYLVAALRVNGMQIDHPLKSIESALKYKIKHINEASHPIAKFARAVIIKHVVTNKQPRGAIVDNKIAADDILIDEALSDELLSMLRARGGVFFLLKKTASYAAVWGR